MCAGTTACTSGAALVPLAIASAHASSTSGTAFARSSLPIYTSDVQTIRRGRRVLWFSARASAIASVPTSIARSQSPMLYANSISSSVEGLGMLVGPIAAAVILAVGGAGAVLAAFAVTSALGAFAASRLRMIQVTVRDLFDEP